MTAGEAIRKIIIAYSVHDEPGFAAVVREFIAEERKKNHHVLANDLERLLKTSNGFLSASVGKLRELNDHYDAVPRDEDRDTLLVDVKEAHRDLYSILLEPDLKQILDKVIEENRRAELLHSFGLKPARRLLFCGPPGCGKTVTAEAIANALYCPLVLVRFDAVVSSLLGETAVNLGKIFDFARSRPMVLFFDEFDAIGKERSAEDEHGELKRVVTALLQMIDGFQGDTVIIAASNHQGLLDPALWRRFDEILYFDKPTKPYMEEMLRRQFRQIGLVPGMDIADFIDLLAGMTYADVERVANDAIKQAILYGKQRVDESALLSAIYREQQRQHITLTHRADVSSDKAVSRRRFRKVL